MSPVASICARTARRTALLGATLLLYANDASAQRVETGVNFENTRVAIFDGLANQIGQLPNPNGGGFTYELDASGQPIARQGFGPVFGTRSETTGKGTWTFDFSFTHHTFDEADGIDLKDGSVTTLNTLDPDPTDPSKAILFETISLVERVRADAYTISALYGLTDRIDIGVVIPVLSVRVSEHPREEHFTFLHFVEPNPCGLPPGTLPCFGPIIPSGKLFTPASQETRGLGDIVIRGKWNFLRDDEAWGGRFGIAAALDIKLPSGNKGDRHDFTDYQTFARDVNLLLADITDEQFKLADLPLGTGVFRVRPQLIVSGAWFGFAPHANLGVELGTSHGISNDLVYEAGFDYTIVNRATLSVDVLGRHAFSVKRIRLDNIPFKTPEAKADNLTISVGAKVNLFEQFLLFANLLVPLDNTGIRDHLTPTFGIEQSF